MRKPKRSYERALHLETLAPEFSESHHGMYLDTLERAIEEQPEARNIALAGSYGVGKSSVLGEFAERRKKQVIKISLLTLGVEPEEPAPGSESNPNAFTTSNRIQKEIVKQLLYQHSPAQTRLSRFRRIVRSGWRKELPIALVGGVVILLLVLASGLLVPAATAVGIDLWSPPSLTRLTTVAAAAFALIALLVHVARLIVAGHVGIEKVAAGPATITLPSRSTSYFDEYLDEIIYFFEVASGRDIVIIEDLDRFNDPGIYESLRSLNGLLNSAQQLHGRNIRFVYAVRDSIFEGHGLVTKGSPTAIPGHETDRGNRTKFFELIIPMVPFITHKNARDLLLKTLAARNQTIERQLVDLVARHVPDMRLIHNIVNEYEVFKHQLLDVEHPVPGLDAERLFSMVVFKNTQAADFEAIRRGDSRLDRLFKTWRELVGANTDRLRDEADVIHGRLEQQAAASEHAEQLGDRLMGAVDVLVAASGSTSTSRTIFLNNEKVDPIKMRTPDFWTKLQENESSLSLLLRPDQWSPGLPMKLDLAALETMIGMRIDATVGTSRSRKADRAKLEQNAVDFAFLRRHTWQHLLDHDEFLYEQDDIGSGTFRQWTEYLLSSDLAVDLVAQGYITSYFPLHVSSFYGQLIRPNAMTYIMRSVDTGTPDPDYPLDAQDVEAILLDQGNVVLTDRSMRNVSVVDHLLSSNTDMAATVIRSLPTDGKQGLLFIRRYLTSGQDLEGFVRTLTPHWSSIYDFLVNDARLAPADRVRLFNVAVNNRVGREYDLTDGVATFIQQNMGDITALSQANSENTAREAVQFIIDSGTIIPETSVLSKPVRQALRSTRYYELTAANLGALSGGTILALDALLNVDDEMYAYAIDEPEMYLAARAQSSGPGPTVKDPAAFAKTVRLAEEWPEDAMAVLIRDAAPGCRIAALRDAPMSAWSTLASERRTDVTFDNVQAYFNHFGVLDGNLAILLADAESLPWDDSVDEDARAQVSLQLINADGDLLPDSLRVALAASLDAGPLSTALVESRPGDLIGLLIEAHLITDDQAAFAPRLMMDWHTQEFAIMKSEHFAEFVGPDTLSAAHFGPLMNSEAIPDPVRAALVARMDEYDTLPPDAYQGIASAALRRRVGLNVAQITAVVRGAMSEQLALELLVHYGDGLALPDLQRSLRALGGDLAVVADKGRRRPALRASTELRIILARLQAAGIVSKVTDSAPGVLSVTLRRT